MATISKNVDVLSMFCTHNNIYLCISGDPGQSSCPVTVSGRLISILSTSQVKRYYQSDIVSLKHNKVDTLIVGLVGRFDTVRPKGRGFKCCHVGTLGKSFAHSCLWCSSVKLRQRICTGTVADCHMHKHKLNSLFVIASLNCIWSETISLNISFCGN